jgi:hypothetical protein
MTGENKRQLPDLVIDPQPNWVRIYSSNTPWRHEVFSYDRFETRRTCRLVYDRLVKIFTQFNYDLKETMTFKEFYHYVQSQVKRRGMTLETNQ